MNSDIEADGELFDRNDDRLSACEALHWVAFGKFKTWEQMLADEYPILVRWDFLFSVELREALVSRLAENPYCPVSFREDTTMESGYRHHVLSPKGPSLLRRLRAGAGQRAGQRVSYRELLAALDKDLGQIEFRHKTLEQAGAKLVKAARAKKLIAWGQRSIDGREPPPGADYEEIPSTIFEHPAIKLNVNDWLGMDVHRPLNEWRGYRSDFYNVRFSKEEVVGSWPQGPDRAQEPTPETPGVAAAVMPDLEPKRIEAPPPRRPGPAPGTLNRYLASDQALYQEFEDLIRPKDPNIPAMSPTAASMKLADDKKIKGGGVALSRARRLRDHYNADHPNKP